MNFKKIFISLLALSFSAAAGAANKSNYKAAVENCSTLSELAGSAFDARQNGVPISEMYKTLIGEQKEIREVGRIIIDSAYRNKVEMTERRSKIAKSEYVDTFFRDCLHYLDK